MPRNFIERDYALIEEAAVAGTRCPQRKPNGPLNNKSISRLAREGRLKSEVYACNWRVVTILTGPHQGAATAPPPYACGDPYIVMDKTGTRRNGRLVNSGTSRRQAPSVPRLLRSDEI